MAINPGVVLNVFDLCAPHNNESYVPTAIVEPEVTPARTGAPNFYNIGAPTYDQRMMSADGFDSGFRIDRTIPHPYFTFQFSFRPAALPPDFSSLITSRFFVGIFNRFYKAIGLLLSENEGIAITDSGTGSYTKLPDSADLFTVGLLYYVIRIQADQALSKANIYVTRKDVADSIGQQTLRYTVDLFPCPSTEVDNVRIEIVGNSSDTTNIRLNCLGVADYYVDSNLRPIAVPGVDKTSITNEYMSFDGRDSYDPEGLDLEYWWSTTLAPDGSDMYITGSGTTPSDLTGYTSRLTASSGSFDNVRIGDIVVGDVGYSHIVYVGSDYVIMIKDVLVADSSVEYKILDQSFWGGSYTPGTIHHVLDRDTTPPLLPSDGDSYLIIATATGLWAGHEGEIATWDDSGSVWTFYAPPINYIIYSIADFESYRTDGSGLWYIDDPKPWELDHWDGRRSVVGVILSSYPGMHYIDLLVNDSILDSLPTEVLLNVSEMNVQLGLTPDATFIWNYISDFWSLVENKERIEVFWSSIVQILANEWMKLSQHDYSKSITDIQRTFQRRWLNYDPLYEEQNFETIPAEITTSPILSGYSLTPSVLVELVDGSPAETAYAYDLGAAVPTAEAGQYIAVDSVAYKIIRVEHRTTTIVITSDPFPIDDVIDITNNPPALPSEGDSYLISQWPVGLWVGHQGEIATWISGAWSFAEPARGKYWVISSFVTSQFSNFSDRQLSYLDTILFQAKDANEDITIISDFVYGARGSIIVFDHTNVSQYLSDPTYTTVFLGILCRNAMYVPDEIVSVPRLQEIIALLRVEEAPDPLYQHKDFRVESTITVEDHDINTIQFLNSWYELADKGFLGSSSGNDYWEDSSASFHTTFGAGADLSNYVLELQDGTIHRLLSVTSDTRVQLYHASIPNDIYNQKWWIREIQTPPDHLWAEVSYLDNRPTIDERFGSLINFTLDDLNERTDDLDYLSAVQGLWYFAWHGRTLYNMAVGAQIILGLPFAEKAGTITDIRDPITTTHSRILIQDEDNDAIIRSYLFPTGVGIATNPDTDLPYTEGDTVSQFAPLCGGVEVVDYISDPDWWYLFSDVATFWEPHKIHTYAVFIDSTVFDLANLNYLIDYITLKDPTYTTPFFGVVHHISDLIDISDPQLMGPVVPQGYTYPPIPGWEEISVHPDWDGSPFEVPRSVVTNDPITGYTNPLPPWTLPEFGNLHLFDGPAKIPDPWDAAWPNSAPGSHVAQPQEGCFKLDDNDESGHCIHKLDLHTTLHNTLSDSDMESAFHPGNPSSPWLLVLPGGLPYSINKTTGQVYAGALSLLIRSVGAGYGVAQNFDTTYREQFPVSVIGKIYIVNGSAQFTLIDQDGSTIIATTKRSIPVNQWVDFVIYAQHISTTTQPIQLRITTGPAGGDFYLDNVEGYAERMPWDTWGVDRAIIGRTGGYTHGGSPDEYWEFFMYAQLP